MKIRKRIVRTLQGDSLPPQTEVHVDDSGNPFEIDIKPEYQVYSVSVEIDGTWLEIATFYNDQGGAR
ncbi:MAG TPA: hypothetical protein VLH09_14755 [Bryobacteraceae bacterium]|nr:hypothetical protein [Bryobacteraceae bacterium]